VTKLKPVSFPGVRRPVCLLQALLLAAGVLGSSLPAIALNDGAQHELTSAVTDWPLLPPGKIRSGAAKGEIFQLDDTPLAGRRVLLLVHGGGGENRPCFRWGKLVKAFSDDPEASRQFKIFLFRYNTEEKIALTGSQLKDAVLQLRARTGCEKINLLCLSMGGNLAQRAMLDPEVDSAVERVFCLATPFHGSPLFSPGWFQYSLDRTWYMPWARPVHRLDYLLYFSRHRSLQEELKWDNADQLIPDIGKFKNGIVVAREASLTPEDNANPQLAGINRSKRINKSKFVTYGGYLVNSYLLFGKRKLIERTLLAPVKYVTVKLPVQLGREHPALKLLNAEMSNLAVNPDAPVKGQPSRHSYMLNDGIAPISSALYLPEELIRNNPMLAEKELSTIAAASDVHLARAFRDMDHCSFLDGKPPRIVGGKGVIDQLHPEHGRRPIFQWIIHDLLEHSPGGQPLASH
jgi:hypothetical protein